jgi:hypothetical protein
MNAKVWFVRHRPTGRYLPLPRGRGGRGGSYVEPADPSVEPPRPFWSKRAAQSALGLWLLGKFYERSYQTYNGDYDVDAGVTPVPSRRREEMDIVCVEINLPGIAPEPADVQLGAQATRS